MESQFPEKSFIEKIAQILMAEGDIETANLFLNAAFEINGTVVHGNEIGRSIDFPTANIQIADKNKIIPKNGVYAVKILLILRKCIFFTYLIKQHLFML